MSNRQRRYLTSREVEYLRSQIAGNNPARVKVALQQLCKLFRWGAAIKEADRRGIENAIMGALFTSSADEKVRRWALASLSYVGRPTASRDAVVRALKDYPNEPQVLAAAIATLFKWHPDDGMQLIGGVSACSPDLITLAALQTTTLKKLNVGRFSVDIDKADEISLKLALLLVGLDRAPPNLFDQKFSNGAIVKVLGGHDEPIISQYSVWAAAENPSMGVENVGVDFRSIDSLPSNVRAYLYRLFAQESSPSTLRHDVICQGSQDVDDEARAGLAIGLRDAFYDGLDEVTVNWFYDEPCEDITLHVLDHITAQSERLEGYRQIAIERYRDARSNNEIRIRLEAAASKTPLYAEFRRICFEEDAGSLGFDFRGITVINNNTLNNSGTMQGPVSLSGDAANSGTLTMTQSVNDVEAMRALLLELSKALAEMPIAPQQRDTLETVLAQASSNPSKENASKVLDAIKIVEGGFSIVDGMEKWIVKLSPLVDSLSNLIS